MADVYKKKPDLTHICGRLNIMARTPYPNLAEPKQKPDFHTQIRTFGFFWACGFGFFFVTAQPDFTGRNRDFESHTSSRIEKS